MSDELIVRAVKMMTMNMTSRFNGREIKNYGQEIISALLNEKNIGVFFGQQLNFKPRLPSNYEYIGGSKTFIIYNKAEFRSNDEKQYRQHIKALQQEGQLPYQYLPENNFVIVKLKSKHRPKIEFIAIAWMTDDTNQKAKHESSYRKISDFAATIAIVERLPVMLGGTFRLSMEDAYDMLPAELRLHTYPISSHPRRAKRATNVFITSSDIDVDDIQTLTCGKLKIPDGIRVQGINFEDAFFNDPVESTMFFMPIKSRSRPRPGSSLDMIPDELDAPSPLPDPEPKLLDDFGFASSLNDDFGMKDDFGFGSPLKKPTHSVEEQEVHMTLDDEDPLESMQSHLTSNMNGNTTYFPPPLSNTKTVLREGDYSHVYDEDLIAKNNWCYMS